MISARDELHEAMCFCRKGGADECESVDQLIDNFAHELAEKIRVNGHRHRWKYFGSRSGTRCVYCNTTVEWRKETATARANALSMMLPGIDYSDETFKAANEYLDAYRDEVLKGAASLIDPEAGP